jgi:hypothetical protein
MATTNTNSNGPKYLIDFEGNDFEWTKDTITEAELRALVGIDGEKQLLIVNLDDGSESPFPAGTYELKPGHGFSRKIGFKRG